MRPTVAASTPLSLSAESKAACWWRKHVLLNSYTNQLLLLALGVWLIRLIYSYLLQVKRYERRERSRPLEIRYIPAPTSSHHYEDRYAHHIIEEVD